MGVPTITGLGPDPEYGDVVRKINSLVNELRNILLTLDTVNVIELNAEVITALSITADKIAALSITADKIAAGTITADKMNVSQLSAIAANLGTITAGIMIAVSVISSTITGSLIQTQAAGNYPRIEFSSTNELLKAEASANDKLEIFASTGAFNIPMLIFSDISDETRIFYLSGNFNITSDGNISLSPVAGRDVLLGGTLNRVQNWSNFFSSGAGQTLQQALDAKANVGITTSELVDDGLGGTKTLNFTNGVLTSVT